MLEPTKRFSSRVENYVKYRPHYPREVIEILREVCGLMRDWRVADIGSGTGISTELFLTNGNPTYGVEPNQPMREAAESCLKEYTGFTSVDGTAEETTLPDSSVELVVAGQAFHWFDRARAKVEFRRILKPGGWVALMWNRRRKDMPFLAEYEELSRTFSPDYDKVDGTNVTDEMFAEFFSPNVYQFRACEHGRLQDYEALKGGLLSSSYSPEPGHPNHEPMIAELEKLFARHERDGRVRFEYDTQVYVGRFE